MDLIWPKKAPTTTTTIPAGMCTAVEVEGSECDSPYSLCGKYMRSGTVNRNGQDWPIFKHTVRV